MKRFWSRLLVSSLVLQLASPAFSWAQQKQPAAAKSAPAPVMSKDEVAAIPDMPRGIDWVHLGADPLIPADLLPADYGKDKVKDRVTLQNIVLGVQGQEAQYAQFWNGVNMVVFLGKGVDPKFESALKEKFRLQMDLLEWHFQEGEWFNGPMAWGYRNINGKIESKLSGPSHVAIPGGIDAYMIPGLLVPSGPFAGHWISLIIPKACINITFNWSEQVNETLAWPAPLAPQFVKVDVRKNWKLVDGKKAKTPSRDVLQLSFTATPKENGNVVRAEAFNNESAELNLEVGKEYVIDEQLKTDDWRRLTDPVTIKVAEKNKDIVFENIEIKKLDLTKALPPVPPPPPLIQKTEHTERTIIEHKGGGVSWKKIIIGGAIGGLVVTAACIKWCGDNTKETVILEPAKGYTSPGQSPK